jgi:colicin import membrane protein
MTGRALGPYGWSLALHGAVVLLLVVGASFNAPEVTQPLPIEAVVVDQSVIEALALERRIDDQRSREAAARREREQQSREQEARREREQEEAKEAAAAELQSRRQAEVERRKKAEADAAAKRKADKEATDRKAREQADARKKADAEAATKRKAEADARDWAQREADLQARLAEEERRAAAVASGAQAQYVAQIKARIQRNWIRPPSARAGLKCIVKVTQIPGGEVVSASLGACNGDEAVKQSILSAVLRSSPLPTPADPTLFVRNLNFEFVPED